MEEGGESRSYGLRKRKRATTRDTTQLNSLFDLAERSERVVVFSGSGLSASSGMSTFSTKGGLYERAQKKFRLSDGKALFTYAFFDRQRAEAQAFFADIYLEAERARPARGHLALAQLDAAGRLRRHYTLNIDGLAQEAGMDTWHHEENREGVTVEMHGNVRYLVCADCHATTLVTPALARQLKALQQVPCTATDCDNEAMRFKVMMYEDAEGECITPDDVMDLMEEDVQAADLILWVGISFQQSASTQYFKKVRHWLQAVDRLDAVAQAVVNPSDDAYFNLISACSNQLDLTQNVIQVLDTSDEVLPRFASRLARLPPLPRPPRMSPEQQQAQQAGEVRAAAAAHGHLHGHQHDEAATASKPVGVVHECAGFGQQQQQHEQQRQQQPQPQDQGLSGFMETAAAQQVEQLGRQFHSPVPTEQQVDPPASAATPGLVSLPAAWKPAEADAEPAAQQPGQPSASTSCPTDPLHQTREGSVGSENRTLPVQQHGVSSLVQAALC